MPYLGCLMQLHNKALAQDVAEILMFLLFEDLTVVALPQRYSGYSTFYESQINFNGSFHDHHQA